MAAMAEPLRGKWLCAVRTIDVLRSGWRIPSLAASEITRSPPSVERQAGSAAWRQHRIRGTAPLSPSVINPLTAGKHSMARIQKIKRSVAT